MNFRVHSGNPLKHFSFRTKNTRSLNVPKEIKGEKNLLLSFYFGKDPAKVLTIALAVNQLRFVNGKIEISSNPCFSYGHLFFID